MLLLADRTTVVLTCINVEKFPKGIPKRRKRPNQ